MKSFSNENESNAQTSVKKSGKLPISFSNLSLLSNKNLQISSEGILTPLSQKNFKLNFHKTHLNILENHLILQILNKPIEVFISDFKMKLKGEVKEVHILENKYFEVIIGFLKETPELYKKVF